MKKGVLSDYFSGLGAKRLSAVEIDIETSHQHEFQGIGGFREFFGTEDMKNIDAKGLYFSDDQDEICSDSCKLSWYDARSGKKHRSAEYRLYFSKCEAMEKATTGDLLIIGKMADGQVLIIMAKKGSTIENQLLWLFGIDLMDDGIKFQIVNYEEGKTRELDYTSKYILQNIGIELKEEDISLDILLKYFPDGFPATRVFSNFARGSLNGISSLDNPDLALTEWMNREELLFRTMERHLMKDRLKQGFDDDVDGFISFSLSIQNRRKSRAGFAFQNHLEQIFIEHKIQYKREGVTENNSKPDFIFPGIQQYHDPAFPVVRLTMLGVKTSCKDRWRQILSEADRITGKHLATLEPAISKKQTDEMKSHDVKLVIPGSIHATFKEGQQGLLMTISDFISCLRDRESQKN